MRNYENTLKIAQTICVDIQKQQMDEIRVGYSGTLDAAKSELERWKGLYLLKVSEIASITNDTATGTEIINN